MPIWYTLANILSYDPCAVYSARCTARRRFLRQNLDDTAKPLPDEVVVNDLTTNEAAPATAETPAPESTTVADGAHSATAMEVDNGAETAAAATTAA